MKRMESLVQSPFRLQWNWFSTMSSNTSRKSLGISVSCFRRWHLRRTRSYIGACIHKYSWRRFESKFIVEECFFESDESTEFKNLQVAKIFMQPTFSKFHPSRITSSGKVDLVQNWILRSSAKWHAYRNYHDWFAFFLENRLEMFN